MSAKPLFRALALFCFWSLSAAAESAAPLGLAQVPWPIIHQNIGGGKDSPHRGPVPGTVEVQRGTGLLPGINQLQGRKYFYYQESGTGFVKAFLPGATQPSRQFDLGASFPLTGGGVIDTRHDSWWTNPNFLIRVSEELDKPVYSERLPIAVPWNAVNFLANGNLLVKSMKGYAVVVGSQPRLGRFPILQSLDLRDLKLDGKRILAQEVSFEPRPVTDGANHFYFPTDHYLVRWSYDPGTGLMKPDIDWAFEVPAGESATFAVSNAVLISDQVCINTEPDDRTATRVYCLKQATGALVKSYQPFPDSRGNPGMHNLGVAKSLGLVYFLVNMPDATGGIAAIDVMKGDVRWVQFMGQVSNAFAISESAGRVYLNARGRDGSSNDVLALDLATGGKSVLYSYPSAVAPLASLFAIGAMGDLFVPTVDGFLRLRNK